MKKLHLKTNKEILEEKHIKEKFSDFPQLKPRFEIEGISEKEFNLKFLKDG